MKQPQILKITRKAASLKEKRTVQDSQNTAAQNSSAETRSPDSLGVASPSSASEPTNVSNNHSNNQWWSQRWIDVLESFGWRRRMERARIYVREGRVLSLEFQGEKVQATVQGTAPDPYNVELYLDAFSDEEWQFVVEALAGQAFYSAKLLAGEMPMAIETVFTNAGLSLFPFSKFDIHSNCDCPDPVNPCKHIGAVYYLLGRYFNQDPFILFQLRGQTKAEIMTRLRQLRTGSTVESEPLDVESTDYHPPHLGDRFWNYSEDLPTDLVVIAPAATSETVLTLLDDIPHPEPQEQALVMAHLKEIYQIASQSALMMAMTNQGSPNS
ncbi:metal-binding protein [Candidatus Synechococcus calcipolaris G9]|uniref:Metal-binding protein n=1 Tax=Candidatus Synechococcus calcipolaris G9 TaxID=1497997 RepID=A0ABT6EZ53_9SYNE|nr:metal-binding protein [Candidatus Synechococcus calcipolaris]MDG2990665.1 metal-binding protein [Candidatus Synechococcus calcipolaris G9]